MPKVRLIDANALKKDLSEFNYDMALRIVDTQPTIEPEALVITDDAVRSLTDDEIAVFEEWLNHDATIESEVRYGQWIPTEYDSFADGAPVWDKWECSKCGHEHNGEEDTLTAFCPDCGASMDVADINVDDKEGDDNGLKPCPFCGGKAELRQEDFDPRWMPTRNDPDSGGCPPYYVKCDNCGVSTEYRYAYPDAEKLWNRRCRE